MGAATIKKTQLQLVKPIQSAGSVPVLRTIDLFSGAGGITEGFRMAGYECLYANDCMPEAIQTFRHNHPESWADCRDKLVRYAAAGAEKARRQGKSASPLDLLLRPPLRFLRMYVLQLGFLDGGRGLAVCLLAAAQVLLKYAELWAEPRAEIEGRETQAP